MSDCNGLMDTKAFRMNNMTRRDLVEGILTNTKLCAHNRRQVCFTSSIYFCDAGICRQAMITLCINHGKVEY